jgi:hypothetical protein
MQNFSIARENMIESQVRPNGITDQRLITAMSQVPREQFVPDNLKSIAYMDEDIALPVGEGGTRRYLLEPMAFARLVQAAKVEAGDIVSMLAAARDTRRRYSRISLKLLLQLKVMRLSSRPQTRTCCVWKPPMWL